MYLLKAECPFPVQILKNTPLGMENMTKPSSWRWFHLMDEAMSGRLTGTAPVVQPSPLDEDEEHNAVLSQLVLTTARGSFSEQIPIPGSVEGVVVLELSGAESPPEVVADERDVMETEPVINKSQAAAVTATVPPDCTAETQETPSSSRATEVDRRLVELHREKQALEREQTEFDRELISLERDRELLNKDMANLQRDQAAVDRDRAALERDRAAVERDRLLLDRDQALFDRDRAFLERDRIFLERAREDLEKKRALLRRDRAALDGNPAKMTTEKEVLLQTRFYQSLMASDLDPDQLETRQRLVSLFQRLVEKL